MMNNLCIIPIRSSSKRLKNKNIRKVEKIPLCIYSINQSIKSKIFDKIVIACDSKKYFQIIKNYFIKNNKKRDLKKINFFLRSKKSSQSNSKTEIVLQEVLKKEVDYNYIFLIQATSPLIMSKDIKNCKNLLSKKKLDSIFSSYQDDKFIWKINKNFKPINYNIKNRPMKQNFKNNLYVENGAIYAFKLKGFKINRNRLFGKIGTVVMPKSRSIDIDTKKDLDEFSNILKKIK